MQDIYNKSDKKAAKKLIKIARKNPKLYPEEEVLYAKRVRKLFKKSKTNK